MEALIALGLASNIVQFVDFASKLCARFSELSQTAGNAPGKIQALIERLSLVLETLNGLDRESLQAVDQERKTVEACTIHIQNFNQILSRFTVDEIEREGSHLRKGVAKVGRSWKAFKSLREDEHIEDLQKSLDRLLALVSLQLQSRTANMLDKASKDILRVLDTLHLGTISKPPDAEISPVSIIPFGRNSGFVGRRAILDAIDRKFRSGQQRVALCGLGGVGKSQIAVEYAFQLQNKSPETSIFWVYTSAGVSFEEAYIRIATTCKIPGLSDPKTNPLQLVRDWLESTYPLKWLMIIDNVDSYETFFKENIHGKPMVDYIPQSTNGSILYTSRNRDIGVDVTLDRDPITVPSMDPEEAYQLLSKDLIEHSTADERWEFFEEIDYLPLAISQAVAYMAKRHKSIRQYLILFRQSDSAKIRLLKHQFSDPGREARQMESLATTFIVSFDYIRAEYPKAAEMLSTICFLGRQMFAGEYIYDKQDDLLDVEESVETLCAFSFVEFVGDLSDDHDGTECGFCDDKIYGMHRLVQLATRAWLDQNEPNGGERYAFRAMELLAQTLTFNLADLTEAITSVNMEERPVSIVMEHGQSLLSLHLRAPTIDTRLAQATIHLECAVSARELLDFPKARKHTAASLNIRKELLGSDNLDTCNAMAMLGLCKTSMFILDEAEPVRVTKDMEAQAAVLFRRALGGFHKTLKMHDPTIVACILMLSQVLNSDRDDGNQYFFNRVEAP